MATSQSIGPKKLFFYYLDEGVTVYNYIRKDFLSIRFQTEDFSDVRLSGEVIRPYEFDELVGFIKLEKGGGRASHTQCCLWCL